MSTTWTPNVPYDSDQQADLDSAVKAYNDDTDKLAQDNSKRYEYIALMMTLCQEGNYDQAMQVAQFDVLGSVTTYSIDTQNQYGDSQRVSSSMDEMSARMKELINDGAPSNSTDGSPGSMTDADGTELYKLQADMWWDLNTTTCTQNGEVKQENYLWMVDPTAKQTMSDATADMLTQYKVPYTQGKPLDNDPDTQGKWIAETTNDWWSVQGNNGQVQEEPLSAVTDDAAKISSTASSQEQSANALLQNQIQITNTYIGANESMLSMTQDQVHTSVGNLKT